MRPRSKSMIWIIRKQKTTNQNNKRKKEPPQNEDSVSSLWYNFKHSNICIMGVPEREESAQEIENLLEKIMTDNVLNLVKKIDM